MVVVQGGTDLRKLTRAWRATVGLLCGVLELIALDNLNRAELPSDFVTSSSWKLQLPQQPKLDNRKIFSNATLILPGTQASELQCRPRHDVLVQLPGGVVPTPIYLKDRAV